MAYTAQQIKDFVKAKGIGNNPNALQAFKDQYGLSDSEVDAALGAGASQKIKEGSAYRGDRQRSTSASDADVARTLSGGFDIDASDPYKFFQAAKLQGWSPEQAARASGRSVDEVQEFLQREGLSLDAPRGVSPSNPSNVRANERTRSDNLPLPRTIGGVTSGVSLDASRNLSPEILAQILAGNGPQGFGTYDHYGQRIRGTGVGADAEYENDPNQLMRLIYGPQSGSGFRTQQNDVFDENGNYIGESSGDSNSLSLLKFAALAGGGYAAGSALAGGAGTGSLATSDIGIGGAMAGGGGGGAAAGTGGVSMMEAAQALATKTGEALPSVLAKMAADPNVWKAGVALVGGALADKGGTGAPGDLAASNMSPQQILQMIQATSNQNFDKSLNASRYNVNTPDGSSSWSQDPKTGQWTNTSSLNPQNQAIKDSRTNFAGQLSQWLPNAAGQYGATAMAGANRSGIPQYQFDAGQTPQLQAPKQQRVTPGQMQNNVQTTAQDWAGKVQAPVANWAQKSANADPWAFDQQASDAMYRANTRYLEPQQQKAQQGLEARLGEQGFVPGTPGYDRAMREMMDSNNQALAQARDTSILAGRQYGDQTFDNSQQGLQQGIAGMLSLAGTGINSDANRFSQNLAQGNFRNTAQQQNFGQQVTQANLTRQAGLDRNATAQQQFDMNLGAGNFRNNAITGANNTANQNFQTDLGAQRNATLDAANWLNGYNPQAPGAAQSNVPGMANPDIASILQQYFSNNVSLQNASTATSNANTEAWGKLLSSIIPSLVNGGK